MYNSRVSDREIMLASPCNFEAMDAELELNQDGQKSSMVIKGDEKPKNNRFKRLVRMILTNTLWAREAATKTQKEQEGFKTENGEKLTFNLNGKYDYLIVRLMRQCMDRVCLLTNNNLNVTINKINSYWTVSCPGILKMYHEILKTNTMRYNILKGDVRNIYFTV